MRINLGAGLPAGNIPHRKGKSEPFFLKEAG